jgi:hypothetical protein
VDLGARSLAALGLARDPDGDPLTYPGWPPGESGVLDGEYFLALREDEGALPEAWSVAGDPETLDGVLRRRGRPVMGERRPMLAVGSNASPGRLHWKLSGRADTTVPMTWATVTGLVAGVSAHVSRPGSVPAAPVLVAGATSRLIVLWLDDEQTAVVDATEPNYDRTVVSAPATVSITGAGRIGGCEVYTGRHGCLGDARGVPYALTGQEELIATLFADLPELAEVAGTRSPREFVTRARDEPGLRERVRELWRREGRALHRT